MRKKLLSILALLCLTVTSARADWTGGTYTATANENLGAITVTADATLTINEGVTVTVTGGIKVTSGTLTIVGPGTLVVNGAAGSDGELEGQDGGSAISGAVAIYSGTITATGGKGGNGELMGGRGGAAFTGTLTYYGGTVNAHGGDGGSSETPSIPGAAFNSTDAVTWVNDPTSGKPSDFTEQNVTFSGPAAIYNMTANQVDGAYWSTFYSNEGNYQAPEGTQVFAVTLTGTAIEMTEIPNRIALSGKGVVLKNTTTGSITMTKTETAPNVDYSGSSLTGTMTSITNPGNAYVLGGTNGAGFYKLKDTGTIGANKAYLTYSAAAREFFLFDETTGIEMPTVEENDNADAVVYDLQGRRVLNPTKGLYIVNGKKVFINK